MEPTTPAPTTPAPTPADWRSGLPDDIKSHASLATVKDVNDLAKGYVNAQSLIGAKRIALPSDKATPEELNQFYAALGRPEAVDKYSEGAITPVEGLTLDKESLGKAREQMFKLGLTDAQQKGIMDFYLGGLNEGHTKITQDIEAGKANAENTLRQEWGTSYDTNLSVVKNVLRHFGNEDVLKELETSIGNSTGLTKMLHNFGKTLLEDKGPKGKFTVEVNTPAAAVQRLAELKSDATFQKALNDTSDPGHKDAVELWTNVHRQLG